MSWRPAKSLDTLLKQVNANWPKRSKRSDGTIGDAAHSARASDHNPNEHGVVCARDFTHDPSVGLDARKLAEDLIASRDTRIKYIISNGQICSGIGGTKPWVWRPYSGANAHRQHVHISVRSPASLYDDDRPWVFGGAAAPAKPPATPAEGTVEWLQDALNRAGASPKLKVDGDEGPKTIAATRAYAVAQLKGK